MHVCRCPFVLYLVRVRQYNRYVSASISYIRGVRATFLGDQCHTQDVQFCGTAATSHDGKQTSYTYPVPLRICCTGLRVSEYEVRGSIPSMACEKSSKVSSPAS